MYQRPGGGIQQSENRERDRKKVDAHGKRNAELDGFHCCTRKPFQIRDFGNIITHQCNVSRFHSNIAAHTAHGNTDACGFQCGCIIDAVPNHAHISAMLLQCGDVADFILRQQIGVDFADADLRRKIVGGLLVVAGQQHCVCLHGGQLLHHCRSFRTQNIRQRNYTDALTVHRNENGCLALQPELFQCTGCVRCHGNAALVQILFVAAKELTAVHLGRNAFAGGHLERRRFAKR